MLWLMLGPTIIDVLTQSSHKITSSISHTATPTPTADTSEKAVASKFTLCEFAGGGCHEQCRTAAEEGGTSSSQYLFQ